MKKREGEPWMSGDDYGRSLRGFGVNLLVQNIERSVAFQTEVLAVEVVYRDEDIAVLRHLDADGRAHEWMLHADHSFSDHPLLELTGDGALRGVGIELRLYDHDPDAAEARANGARRLRPRSKRRQTPRPSRMLFGGPGRLCLGASKGHRRRGIADASSNTA